MKEKDEQTVIIACKVIEPELEHLSRGCVDLQLHYLQHSLRRTAKRMPSAIQEIIDQITGTVRQIVLGYGLCSSGIAGVTARRERVVVPGCHDCISFFLG